MLARDEEYVSLGKWADLTMYAYVLLPLSGAAKDVRVVLSAHFFLSRNIVVRLEGGPSHKVNISSKRFLDIVS